MMKHDMRARISQLHKTEEAWDNLPDFIPFSGEIIVFDPDSRYSYPRLKIGDGVTNLRSLPFFNETIDAGRITEYKK